MSKRKQFWNRLVSGSLSGHLLNLAMDNVALGLSSMMECQVVHTFPKIETIPITEVTTRAGAPEGETVGVYLRIESDPRGEALLILPMESALHLVDFLMGAEPGKTTYLGMMQNSALAEVGNLVVSYFLNALADLSYEPEVLRPSPPAVIVDMLGVILNLIVATMVEVRDDLLVIETSFKDPDDLVNISLWILPDALAMERE